MLFQINFKRVTSHDPGRCLQPAQTLWKGTKHQSLFYSSTYKPTDPPGLFRCVQQPNELQTAGRMPALSGENPREPYSTNPFNAFHHMLIFKTKSYGSNYMTHIVDRCSGYSIQQQKHSKRNRYSLFGFGYKPSDLVYCNKDEAVGKF